MEKRNEATETKEATRTNEATQPDTPRSHSRIRKTLLRKAIPYILVGCIASSAVMMSYNEAEEVKAEAITITALTVCALLAVMATMGITYATQNILETWEDGNNALDPDFEDILSDGKLRETQTANYFSDIYPIDCAVLSANAQSCQKCCTLLSVLFCA